MITSGILTSAAKNMLTPELLLPPPVRPVNYVHYHHHHHHAVTDENDVRDFCQSSPLSLFTHNLLLLRNTQFALREHDIVWSPSAVSSTDSRKSTPHPPLAAVLIIPIRLPCTLILYNEVWILVSYVPLSTELYK